MAFPICCFCYCFDIGICISSNVYKDRRTVTGFDKLLFTVGKLVWYAGDMDYILFVDDDNPIPQNTLLKMLEDDKDIVTCPILTRNPNKDGKHDICCYYAEERDVGDGKTLTYYN